MEDIIPLVDQEALQEFRNRALNPEHPVTRGTAQNPDIFFQAKESSNRYYDAVPDIVANYMKEITKITGREYHPFDYYGDPEAENIIIAMGSVTETIKETIDYLAAQGKKVGWLQFTCSALSQPNILCRQFRQMLNALQCSTGPKNRDQQANPCTSISSQLFYGKENAPVIVGGRYGLGSKDTTPSQILSVYENLEMNEPKNDLQLVLLMMLPSSHYL
jgi:pyruvate-ferredoxin/flavodoxin oxidoreductase